MPASETTAGGALRCRAVGMAAGLVLLGGCASLPVSGPTGHAIEKVATDPAHPAPFVLVEVNDAASLPAAVVAAVPGSPAPTVSTDLVGPGDVLDIQIYEAGVTLFAGGAARGGAGGGEGSGGVVGGAQAERLPPTRVDDGGLIRVPYAGEIAAAGHTTSELAAMIRARLLRMSQNPQVVVVVEQPVAETVIVSGEVNKPGRLQIVTRDETVSDAIALSGGYHGEAKDLVARVTRGGTVTTLRMADIMAGPDRDMRIAPGDRLAVIRAPLTFAVLGAAGKIDNLAFNAPGESLAEAVAAAGGANQYTGDAKAIFVFRWVDAPDGTRRPVVYHLNMMLPGSYFLAQNFAMRDKDVLFVGNAGANQPTKLIQLISQLFAPIVAVESGLVATGAVK